MILSTQRSVCFVPWLSIQPVHTCSIWPFTSPAAALGSGWDILMGSEFLHRGCSILSQALASPQRQPSTLANLFSFLVSQVAFKQGPNKGSREGRYQGPMGVPSKGSRDGSNRAHAKGPTSAQRKNPTRATGNCTTDRKSCV